jgi:protein involved in polysaccharide export with SLBB domain
LIAWLVLVLLVGIGVAQVRSGDLTPQVSGSKYYIWGQVRSPGAYSFLAAPDLVELISAAGGPTDDANLTRVVLIRAVNQTRTRINMQAMLNKGQVVRLSPGDVIMVPSSAWYRFRTGLTVVSSAVTLATLVITILNWVGR